MGTPKSSKSFDHFVEIHKFGNPPVYPAQTHEIPISWWFNHVLVGGIPTRPSEKYDSVSWDDEIPSIWKVIKAMIQTTNQCFTFRFQPCFLANPNQTTRGQWPTQLEAWRPLGLAQRLGSRDSFGALSAVAQHQTRHGTAGDMATAG